MLSLTKSIDQRWFRRIGLGAATPTRRRNFRRRRQRNAIPSWRYRRCTRLGLMRQPARTNSAHNRRYP